MIATLITVPCIATATVAAAMLNSHNPNYAAIPCAVAVVLAFVLGVENEIRRGH